MGHLFAGKTFAFSGSLKETHGALKNKLEKHGGKGTKISEKVGLYYYCGIIKEFNNNIN